MDSDISGFLRKEGVNYTDRRTLIIDILNKIEVKNFAEIGVLKGEFALSILESVNSIQKYFLIDPWRHLDNWNRPGNRPEQEFMDIFSEAVDKLSQFDYKTKFLRGKTTEVVDSIEDESLDAIYIDGDHTLRGITIDLICLYPKVRIGGLIIGDDFTSTIWQHHTQYEPTFVFPFAVYFAEALGNMIFSLPSNQFAIIKDDNRQANVFVDLVGKYPSLDLREQIRKRPIANLGRLKGRLRKLANKAKRKLSGR
jgi:hypothetical protein